MRVRDHVVDLGVALRVQRGEGQVLELLLDLLHAEAVGQRGVDVEGLLGDALLLARAAWRPRVRMLWSRSASLMIRTRRSLAIATSILRMVAACCSSLRVEADPLELGDPVDDLAATSAPNALLDLGRA